MIGENNGIDNSVDNQIEIKYDKETGVIHLYNADKSCRPELCYIDGTRLDVETIAGVNGVDMKFKVNQKLAILKYIDPKGVVRSVKMIL